jgi:transposase-like protein
MAYRARESNQSERAKQSKETRPRTLTEEDPNRVVQERMFSHESEINRTLQSKQEGVPRRSEIYAAATPIFAVGSSQWPRGLSIRAMTDLSSPVADLRTSWHALCDLDRARAVQSLKRAGVSLREIASQLNCSPSLLSYLLRAARAPVEDRELARLGEISTRELVHRAGSPVSRPTSIAREALAFDSECAAVQASRAIANWLDEQKIADADRAKVID